MHVVFVSKDLGNARAGSAVAQALRRRLSHTELALTYALDVRGAAWDAVASGRETGFSGVPLRHWGETSGECSKYVADADAIMVTLSASGAPNLEFDITRLAYTLGKPVYGIEEMLGGRHNPGWEAGEPAPIRCLRRLFTTLPTDEDDASVTVVGPPQLERYRGVDVPLIGLLAREKLGLAVDAPLVYYIGHPEPENPHALSRVGQALAKFRREDLVLVVSRHGRERTNPIPDNSAAHRHTLRHIRNRVGIRVIENSLDHKDFPEDHPEAIPAEFRPVTFVTYQELVCACAHRGVTVTGFATDGLIIPPYLGVPSLFYLDREDYLFGGLLWREKRFDRLPLPLIPQVATVDQLFQKLHYFLADGSGRCERYCATLREKFPFPERDPAEAIVDVVLRDLAERPAS